MVGERGDEIRNERKAREVDYRWKTIYEELLSQLESSEVVYEKPDKIAQFPGGMDAYVTWMSANFHYPEKAIRNNVEGRVVLSFVVNKQGRIKDIKVLHSLSPECDKEAIRMVKAMPRWFAAEHQGRKVNCRYTMPVVFKLNK